MSGLRSNSHSLTWVGVFGNQEGGVSICGRAGQFSDSTKGGMSLAHSSQDSPYPPPFLISIAWCPHRNSLGTPVAGLLCLQRDCGFSLWLMSIIYGHHTSGDWLTDGYRLRVYLPSAHQTVFWNVLCKSVFSVCSRKRKEKNLPTSSQSSPQPVIPKRLLVQVSTLWNWKLFSVCIDIR